MTIQLKVNSVELITMKSLHLHLNRHLYSVVPTNRRVLKYHPQTLSLVFQLLHNFTSKNLTNQLQTPQLPQIHVSTTVPNYRNRLRILRKRRMLVFRRNLRRQLLDRLVGVQRRVQHVQLLLKNSQVSAIRTVLDVQDRILMVFYLFSHTSVLDIEDTQHSRLKTSRKVKT